MKLLPQDLETLPNSGGLKRYMAMTYGAVEILRKKKLLLLKRGPGHHSTYYLTTKGFRWAKKNKPEVASPKTYKVTINRGRTFYYALNCSGPITVKGILDRTPGKGSWDPKFEVLVIHSGAGRVDTLKPETEFMGASFSAQRIH